MSDLDYGRGLLHPNPYIINLIDGEEFNYADAIHGPVTLHAVAHALARQVRFTGHVAAPHYSVAEHAILVSQVVKHIYHEPELALAALHHDDAEFVTGDINKPFKNFIQDNGFDFRKLERQIMVPISQAFEIPMDEFGAGVIKDADLLVYCAEIELLKPAGHGPLLEDLDPEILSTVKSKLMGLDPEQAESAFTMYHQFLTGNLKMHVIEFGADGEQTDVTDEERAPGVEIEEDDDGPEAVS